MRLGLAKAGYERAPLWLKWAYAAIPFPIRMGAAYRTTLAEILRTEELSRAELDALQSRKLGALIGHSYEHVPYYREVMKKEGLTPSDFKTTSDLSKLPLLTKDAVRRNRKRLIAENWHSSRMYRVTTGGTSGRPLEFLLANSAWPREWAFLVALRGLVGYSPMDRMLTLRGVPFPPDQNGRKPIHRLNPMYAELLLSPFSLTEQSMEEYVSLIEAYKPAFFHGYPSAFEALARFVEHEGYQERVRGARALFAISENLRMDQRRHLEKVFGLRVFSHYGQSERVIFAGECPWSTDYHIYPQYGVTEILDEHGDRVTESGKRGDLVGTSFLSPAMPLIRYSTGDSAEYVGSYCEHCRRDYQIIRHISGRWTQEMLVAKAGNPISITALNMHSDVFRNVLQFRFFQHTPGVATLKVVAADGFGEMDRRRILDALAAKVGDQIEFAVEIVSDLPRTHRGKHQFLEQAIPPSQLD